LFSTGLSLWQQLGQLRKPNETRKITPILPGVVFALTKKINTQTQNSRSTLAFQVLMAAILSLFIILSQMMAGNPALSQPEHNSITSADEKCTSKLCVAEISLAPFLW
jgi:hypothetical protein